MILYPAAREGAYTVPEGTARIGADAFAECRGLTSVTLPEGLTDIGAGAFRHCTGLTGVIIPDGVANIGRSAFFGCGFTQAVIPASVTYIADSAFSHCDQVVLRVLAGSYAEQYAWKNKIPYASFRRADELVDGNATVIRYFSIEEWLMHLFAPVRTLFR